MIPARGKVLLRPVETSELLPGGRILLTERTRQDLTSHQMEVLAIGASAYCINPDCERCNQLTGKAIYPEAFTHQCDAKVGDWVLVAHRSLSETDTDGVFICSQDSVLAVLTA